MRLRRIGWAALVLATLAACKPAAAPSSSESVAPAPLAQQAAGSPAGPGIKITVVLSPAAARRIAQTGQTITLPAEFYGMPTSPQVRDQLQGRLDVGPEQDVVLRGPGTATILVPPLDPSKIAQVQNGQVMVAVDVSSGNHTTDDNLLNCNAYMDVPLDQAENQQTTLTCKLIGEP